MTRKDMILGMIEHDQIVDFFYYDRKEDEELPVGAIQATVAAGELTVDEMVEAFKRGLKRELSR